MTDATIRIDVLSDTGHINLRGNPQNNAFVETAESVLDQKLPVTANTLTEGEYTIYWLGPDEFQIVCQASNATRLCQRLEAALSGVHFAVNDLSGGQIALCLRGECVPAMLAKGCTLDLHPVVFPVGACAQSGLGKSSVLIGNPGQPDHYNLIVHRSFSDYVVKWLLHAGAEYGVKLIGVADST